LFDAIEVGDVSADAVLILGGKTISIRAPVTAVDDSVKISREDRVL